MEFFIILLVAALIFGVIYIFRNLNKIKDEQKKIGWQKIQDYATLRIDVPKNNEKQPLAAEQMFAALHGIYSSSAEFQTQMSFEIVAKDKYIQFYVTVPRHIKDFVEGQIYAQYPTVEINDVNDYTQEIDRNTANYATAEILLTKPDVYPIKFFSDFEVDPLSGITSVMSKLNPGEQVWFQLIIRPVGDEWQDRGNKIVSSVRSGKPLDGPDMKKMFLGGVGKFGKAVLMHALKPGYEEEEVKSEVKLPASVEEALKGIEQKITKLGFETKIRIAAVSSDLVTARVRCQTISAAFKQFNTNNLNGFASGEIHENNREAFAEFVGRYFGEEGSILNITELASVFHLPHKSVETPNIVWSGSKKGEPPANLPLRENTDSQVLTVIGETTFRNVYREFGIKLDDRRRHIYIIGKSGVGKSVLIENMAVDDVTEGRGVIVIDPHGDLADKILSVIPDNRIQDVVVFDPADRSYPIAFNLLEKVDDDFKGMVASGFVGIFKKIFGDSWGPRLEHILRNTVLALLDFPESTMLDIPKMLTESRFRDKVIEHIKDPVIRDFWVNEFAQYDAKFRTEAVSPILNKVGQFLSTATIRNIVGQPHSKINIREIMDSKKIMVVNLSRGKIGEDNSALLGAMMVTKIQLAAMSRADVSIENRPDTYLYVDEFQNFATDSFAIILAEARKYNLNLTIANQYIAQLPETVRDAVFGNAGTMITFRIGGADATYLVKEYEPIFDANDLVNLDKFHVYIKLLIDGISSPAFSGRTLPPVQVSTPNAEKAVNYSREHYSTPRAFVEEQIQNWAKQEEEELRKEAEMFRQGGLEAILKKGGAEEYAPARPSQSPVHHPEKTIQPPEIKQPAPEENPTPAQSSISSYPVAEETAENKTGDLASGENTETEKKEKPEKPRVLKYKNILGDKLFKEQTAKGGIKWYVGEDIDMAKFEELGIEVTPEALKMMELAKKVGESGSEKKTKEDHMDNPPAAPTKAESKHEEQKEEIKVEEKNSKKDGEEPEKKEKPEEEKIEAEEHSQKSKNEDIEKLVVAPKEAEAPSKGAKVGEEIESQNSDQTGGGREQKINEDQSDSQTTSQPGEPIEMQHNVATTISGGQADNSAQHIEEGQAVKIGD